MKKILLFIAMSIYSGIDVFSQSCLPEGIYFASQNQIDNFQNNYPGCTQIEGDVTISDQWTGSITNLSGLSMLTSIGGSLNISGNSALTSLAGLINITVVGGNLDIGNDMYGGNAALVNLLGLEGLTSIGGGLQIGSYSAWNDHVLKSLSGLDNLTSIGNYLKVFYTDSLTSLSGLGNLTSIGGDIDIEQNHALASMTGLEKLNTIGGTLRIQLNDSLSDLIGFVNLSSIGGDLVITDNAMLATLSGLDNIDAGSIINLGIAFNPTLSECEVNSVCNYLASPNGNMIIYLNASGCNSQQEVETACAAVGIETLDSESSFTIYPNPAITNITIETPTTGILSISSLDGKVILQQEISGPITNIDIKDLPKGVYAVRLINVKSVLVALMAKQ
jgi:hypothetical protein